MDRQEQIDEIKKFLDKFYDTENISIYELNIENKITDVLKRTDTTGVLVRKTTIEIEYAEHEETKQNDN